MAYTIIRSDGTTLTTIQDGTINTTSTSLGLPGRNYAGYGQTLNTNFVRQLENYAGGTPPINALRGQLWYDTSSVPGVLKVCPTDGLSNPTAWVTLASTNSTGDTTLGKIITTDNVDVGGDLTVTGDIVGDTITVRLATVSETLTATSANITSATIPSLTGVTTLSTGSATTAGTLTGAWSVIGNNATGGNALSVISGNIAFAGSSVNGIKCDNYMYANGAAFNPAGTYTNANVSDFFTGANSVTRFTGNIAPTKVTTSYIAGGGVISGVWTLDTGARLEATYADLAERFEADDYYDAGTVLEIGGEKEVTAVVEELSEDVFGVVSNTAAYLMNGKAGTDKTHPAIAVSGRVQVKVVGPVRKGQRLVSAGKGKARAAKKGEATAFNVIGRALEHKTSEELGTVLAIVAITK